MLLFKTGEKRVFVCGVMLRPLLIRMTPISFNRAGFILAQKLPTDSFFKD